MKNLFQYCFLFLLISLTFNLSAQQSITIKSNTDACLGYHTYLSEGNTNYGNAIQNAAYNIPGYMGGYNINRALIYFELPEIPVCKKITSAKLNLYALSPCGSLEGHTGTNNSAVLRRVMQNWNEQTVTFNNSPTTTEENQVILPASTSPSQDYLNIDVTALVKDMFRSNNYGFFLKLQNEVITNALTFCSSDYYDSGKHPTLTIEYEDIPDSTPIAGYTYEKNDLVLSFTNISENTASYLWDFGDGTSSSEINPTHTYVHPGVYSVCLTASNSCGHDIYCSNIEVGCIQPSALFSYEITGLSVKYHNNSTNALTYSWNFGDGTFSDEINPIHTYENQGSYEVCLTASNSCGSDVYCVRVEVNCSKPIAEYLYEITDHLVVFRNTSEDADHFYWNFGDGSTSFAENPEHLYLLAGDYQVTLVASNECDSDTIMKQIKILQLPEPEFTYENDDLTVRFINESMHADTYLWDFGDGTYSNIDNPFHEYTRHGVYNVCLSAFNNDGNATKCHDLIFCSEIRAYFTFSVAGYIVAFKNYSIGASSYLWEFGDGQSSTEENSIHTYREPGFYTAILYAINACDTVAYSVQLEIQDCDNRGPGFGYTCDGKNVQITLAELPQTGDHINIFDVNGNLLRKVELSSNIQKLPVEGLKSGLYVIDIHLRELSFQRRIMIIE